MNRNFRSWIRESITVKFIIVTILVLLLLIPASMIRSLIQEREKTRDEVIAEVSTKWANEQLLTGPIITIPYNTRPENRNETETVKKYAHFLHTFTSYTGDRLYAMQVLVITKGGIDYESSNSYQTI